MANRAWAEGNDELETLLARAEAYGATEWTLSNERRTRSYVQTKQEGECLFIHASISFLLSNRGVACVLYSCGGRSWCGGWRWR
jgi:hypothetical protein